MTEAPTGSIFLASVAGLSLVSSAAIVWALDLPASNPLTTIFWMSGFVSLAINVSYFVVTLTAWIVMKESRLPEAPLTTLPPTAVVYVVRNERANVVMDNVRHSLENNLTDHMDAWVLSNSDLDTYVTAEGDSIARLQSEFGCQRVQYFRASRNPLRRKHVCVHEWLAGHPEYRYVVICDADSRLPRGSVRRLVAKAEHPDNSDVALFQSHISIDEQPTCFVRMLGLTQELCQRLYATVHQQVFGRGVSYGSGHLVRASAFARLRVPDWVLSHDIWDTVSLEEAGSRVVFCGDVRTFGSFPINYIEYLNRSRRWILGTLESIPCCATRQVPLGTRFMTLYPTYMYLFQPLFVLWIAASVLCDQVLWRSLFSAQQYAFLGASAIDLEMGSHLALTLTMALGPRALRSTSLESAGRVLGDIVTSLLLCLNSILFDSFAVVEFAVTNRKAREWVPMKKGAAEHLALSAAVKKLWPAVAIGAMGLSAGVIYAPRWTLVAAPFFCAFLLSVPLAYWTGRVRSVTRAA